MSHLTLLQRYEIVALLKANKKQKEIAAIINVHPSSICREIQRNALKGVSLDAEKAQKLTNKRRTANRTAYKLTKDKQDLIRKYIENKDSPEQTRYHLLHSHQFSISIEWIYQFIYSFSKTSSKLHTHLRQRRRKRKKRSNNKHYRLVIPDKISIQQRPQHIQDKTEVGHWEIDTIVGANHQSYILTLVERISKFTILYTLPNLEKETMKNAFTHITKTYFSHSFKSFTCDNGIEFSCHKDVTNQLQIPFYFAHPYSPWERGLNENTNGLIRQFLPKSTDFNEVKISYIKYIQNNLNNRIRKTLNFTSPHQFLLSLNNP